MKFFSFSAGTFKPIRIAQIYESYCLQDNQVNIQTSYTSVIPSQDQDQLCTHKVKDKRKSII